MRPYRAAIQPTGAVMMAEAMTYEVSTQVIWSIVLSRLLCMKGSATLAMVLSSTCISVAIITQPVMRARCFTVGDAAVAALAIGFAISRSYGVWCRKPSLILCGAPLLRGKACR